MSLTEQKAQLRKVWRAKPAPSPAEKKSLSEKICGQIAASRHFKNAERICIFMGRDHEPDLLPLWKLKPEKILAPRTDLATGTVRFYKFSALSELNPGPGGIREPKANSGEEIAWASGDLILVPGLSFDQRGTRLGSGLGCYDRFLRSLPKGILFLAVCFDYQVSKQPLPVDSHDIPIHAICTPSGLTRISLSGEF